MPPVLQPGPGHAYVVGGTFTFSLDQNQGILNILAVPLFEGLQPLEPIAVGVDLHLYLGGIHCGLLVQLQAPIVAIFGQLVARGGYEFHIVAVVLDGVGHGVEGQVPRQSEGRYNFRGGHEGVGSRVTVITSGEVAVVAVDDGVGFPFLYFSTLPLPNAGATSIGQYSAPHVLKDLY